MPGSIPPGARWITVHPNGPNEKGHPVLISEGGVILGGLGGVHNGKELRDIYSGHSKIRFYEGRPLPENLSYARPDTEAHRKHFEHWGPEFDIQVEGDPEYIGGRWHLHVRNPHLERAVAQGLEYSVLGARLEPHPEGGVIYHGLAAHPGRSGYTSFGMQAGRDLVGYIGNYLSGEHEKRLPRRTRAERVSPRPPLTEEERRPSKRYPFGRTPTGRAILGPDEDPLRHSWWEPRPDIVGQGRATPPAAPAVSTTGQAGAGSGLSWTNPLQALRRAFGRRSQPRDPYVREIPPTPLPPGPDTAPETASSTEPSGPLALAAPSDESAAASFFDEGPQRGMPAIRQYPPVPKEEPAAAADPIEDLRRLAREREEAAWRSSDLEDTLRREGRTPSSEEQQELSAAQGELAEREQHMQALITHHNLDAQAVRAILGEDFTPTPTAPQAPLGPTPASPAPAPPTASAEAPTSAQPMGSALDRIAAEMAEENESAAGPEQMASIQPSEPPPAPVSQPPSPEPGSIGPGGLVVGDDWRTSGGVVHTPGSKGDTAPDEKTGGPAEEPAPTPATQPSDEELEAEWARWEAEHPGKSSGRSAIESQAAELGLSPEEMQEYLDEYQKEADEYEGQYGQLARANKLISDVKSLGGVHGSGYGEDEYNQLPLAVKNRHSGHTLDTLLGELNETYGYGFDDLNALHEALVGAGNIQVDQGGIKAFGVGRQVKSKFALMRDRERQNQQRREVRALRKQGTTPPVRRRGGPERDVRLAASPEEEAVLAAAIGGKPMSGPRAGSRKRMTPDCYAVPVKEMLPIDTGPHARQSWDALDRTPGLSAEERAEAERRILDALHVQGLPEHEGLAAALFAASHSQQALDAEQPSGGGAMGGPPGGGMGMDEELPPDLEGEAGLEGIGPEDELDGQMEGEGLGDEGEEFDPGMLSDEEGAMPGEDDMLGEGEVPGEDELAAEGEEPLDEEGMGEGPPPGVGAGERAQSAASGPPAAPGGKGGAFGGKSASASKAKPKPKAKGAEDEEGDEEEEEEERPPVKGKVKEAVLDARRRDKVKTSQFAFPEQRKLPIHDAPHVRAAMARFNQTQGMSAAQKKAAWSRITNAARRLGVAVSAGQKRNTQDVHESEATVSIPSRIPVQFMSVGHGNKKDGHFYSEDAVRALVDCVRGQPKMFISHSDAGEVSRHGHRPLEQLGAVAVRESVRYDPVRRACVGEAVLRPSMREYVETAHAAGDTIGISVDGKGLFRPGTRECVGWSQFYSADFVPRGGAGGFTLSVRESERPDLVDQEKEFVLMSLLSSLTAGEVREHNAELYEAIGRAYADAHPTEAVRETAAGDYERLVRENETMATERDQAMARLDELEAERNREQVARFVDQLVRECGLEQTAQVTYVTKLFAGATCGPRGTYQTREELEGAVRETTEEYLATLPTAPSGEITGQGAMRADGVRESTAWTNPLQIANEGMAMLWGHEPGKPASNGAGAPAAS